MELKERNDEFTIITMPPEQKPTPTREREGYARQCMFSGLLGVEVGDDPEADLGNGFSLVKPNKFLLSAREKDSMTGKEFADAAAVSRYLVYKHEPPAPPTTYEEIKAIFQCGILGYK